MPMIQTINFPIPFILRFRPQGFSGIRIPAPSTFRKGVFQGTWNAVLSVRDRVGNSLFYVAGSLGFGDSFPGSFNGQFTVGPLSATTFGDFTPGYGLTGTDALPSGNPDGDLFNNAMELLLGLDPTSSSRVLQRPAGYFRRD